MEKVYFKTALCFWRNAFDISKGDNIFNCKKVLVLTPFYSPNIGGAETFTEHLVLELSKHFKVTVLTFQPFNQVVASYENKGNYEIYRINWPFKPPKAWQGTGLRNFLLVFPALLWAAFWLNRQKRFDRVVSNGLISSGIGSLLNVPAHLSVLLALYDFKAMAGFKRAISRLLFAGADKIYVEGLTEKQDVLDLGIKESRIIPYQHWVDHDIYKPTERKNKEVVVLFLGRLSLKIKGVHIIKEVEKRLIHKSVRFIYAETVSHENIQVYYQMADVVVIPSLYSEGIPLVAIEAASCGCAVITTDKGSLPEVVLPFGIVVSEHEGYVNGFVRVISALIDNRFCLEKMKKKAFVYSRNYFSNKNANIFIEGLK